MSVMDERAGLYDFPAYYESVFDRDFEKETDFLEACLRRHGVTDDRSFLELGCGPARNARAFARRGWRAVGLDNSPTMLAYAGHEAQREGASMELVEGDLREFELARAVGLAACLWETICVLATNEDMLRHLRAVARNLLPGGTYVIETSHPRNFLEPYTGVPHRGRVGDATVELTWGFPTDPYDPVGQWYQTTVELLVRRGGELVARDVSTMPQRWYLVQELRALVELSGVFSEVHFYGTNRAPLVPLADTPECNGMLAVLVRR